MNEPVAKLPMRTLLTAVGRVLHTQSPWRVGLLLAGMVTAAAFEMVGLGAIPGYVALVLDPERLLAMIPDGHLARWVRRSDVPVLALAGAAALAGIFLAKNVFIAAVIYSEARLVRDVAAGLANRLFSAYVRSSYSFHLRRNPAQLIRNIANECEIAVDLLRNLATFLRESLVLALVVVLLLLVDPVVTLAVASVVGAAALTFYLALRNTFQRRGALAQKHRERRTHLMSQALASIKEVKLRGSERFLIDSFAAESHEIEGHKLFPRVMATLPRLVFELVALFGLVLVTAGFVLLGRDGQDMLPVFTLLAVAMARLIPTFNAITGSLANIRYDWPSMESLARELGELEDDGFRSEESRGVSRENPLALPPFRRELTVTNLVFRHEGAASDTLREVSLTISARQVVGIIGPSGAGKSTLVDVLLGLLPPSAGTVSVDGVDIHDDLSGWQRQVGYVPQDICVIDDTIRRNVAFGVPDSEIDTAAVKRALAAAQLATFIAELPHGLDTVVGNRGVRLSGGQRQRIGIARALYGDPALIVMDEATSALDGEAEAAVMQAISEIRESRTVILVAHRLSTVRSCDVVFLIQEGRVTDFGSFVDLLERHREIRAYALPFSAVEQVNA
jgi:ATP-binding cassette, subfamily B, bacterial PglK